MNMDLHLARVQERWRYADGGGEIIEITAQERRRWVDKVAPIDEAWAAGLEAKGLPGRALLKDARALAAVA